jgi:acetylornithine/N-succinyldiaminopimelate aminotransferase
MTTQPAASHVMNTYARLPVTFTHGEGVWLWDESGRKYLDALAGIAVNGLGHAHPRLTRALADQVQKLIHTSNIYGVRHQETLADRICALSGMDDVFFGSSGAEANEAALKLARFYGHKNGIAEAHVIVMEHAWHGRTIATLSATGSPKAQAGFEPLVPGFPRVAYNDIKAVEDVAARNPNVVAVLVEVLQGEGGIHVADVEYIRALRRLCDDRRWLLMVDEVQCGIGRTGKWFGFQWSGIKPDVMTLAKGLGSGVPIGACVTAGRAHGLWKPGNHGSTFGGGPLVCRAGIETLAVMEDDRLLENATKMGELIRGGLREALSGVAGMKQVRGQGLMIGIELDRPCGELVKLALDAGLLINVTRDSVVRLLPPLIINADEAGQIVSRLGPLIKQFLARP